MSDIVDIGVRVDSSDVNQGSDALDKFGDAANRNEKKTAKLESAIRKTGAALGVMAAAATAAAATFSVVKTTEFNKSISELQAITGAAGEDLAYLRSQAKLLGSTTTQSASQVATAFKLVASAKPDLLDNAAALSQVTEQVILLAEASGGDLAASADTVGASLNQFGVEADQAARFVNVLAAGSKFGSSAVNETSEALKNAGTVAANAGLSFEQTNAAIQAMAKVAIKGGEAGTGLRGVLLKLSTQTNDDFNPKIVGFTQAIKNLEAAELSDVEMKKLFGQESITAANALIQEADNLDSLTSSLTDTTTAIDQARINNNNLEGDMKSLTSVIEGQAIAFGEKLDPSLRVLVKGFTDVISLQKETANEAENTRLASLDLAIGVAQVADIAGNAAKGIALPFGILGDAIGGVAAQISFIMEGEFSKAMAAGEAATNSMKQRLLDATDPKIVNRFENIAKEMKFVGDIEANGNMDAYLQAIEAGASKAEAKLIAMAQAQADLIDVSPKEKVKQKDPTVNPKDNSEFLAWQEEQALIDGQAKADSIEREQAYLAQLQQAKADSMLTDEELEAAKVQRELDRIDQSKQRLIEAGLSEVEAIQQTESAKSAVLAASAKKQADDAIKNEANKQAKIASLQSAGWNTLAGIAALGGKKYQKMVLEADLLMATSKAISGSVAAWTSGMELGGLPVAIASEAAHWGHVVGIMGQLKGMGASGATATPPSTPTQQTVTTQPVSSPQQTTTAQSTMNISMKIEGLTGNESPAVLQQLTDMMTPAIVEQIAAGGTNVSVV